MTRDEISHAVRQHLDSLQSAGVEWIPDCQQPLTFSMSESTTESVDPLEERKHELEMLSAEIVKCTRCPALASTRTQTVFGVGQLDPEVCFLGEAPGGDEDKQGEPFVGAAGQLLNRIISACGMRREEVYICNILKCRPPANRTPKIDEVDNCRGYLEKQLELVNPKYIVALGGTAAKYLLETSFSVARLRGKLNDYKGIPVVVTYHPAYLLPHRSDSQSELQARKRKVWEDMKFLLKQMGRDVENPQAKPKED